MNATTCHWSEELCEAIEKFWARVPLHYFPAEGELRRCIVGEHSHEQDLCLTAEEPLSYVPRTCLQDLGV